MLSDAVIRVNGGEFTNDMKEPHFHLKMWLIWVFS